MRVSCRWCFNIFPTLQNKIYYLYDYICYLKMQLFYGMILARLSYTMGKYMYNTKQKENNNS